MPAKHFVEASYLRECFDYDRETGEFRWRVRPAHHFRNSAVCGMWNTRFAGKPAFTQRATNGYLIGRISVDGVYFKLLAHRAAWVLVTGEQPKDQIDHIDRDRSNNRFANLRQASQSENNWNSRDRNYRDLPRGVYRNGNGFSARVDGRHRQYIGTFDTPEAASEAWQQVTHGVRSSFMESA